MMKMYPLLVAAKVENRSTYSAATKNPLARLMDRIFGSQKSAPVAR